MIQSTFQRHRFSWPTSGIWDFALITSSLSGGCINFPKSCVKAADIKLANLQVLSAPRRLELSVIAGRMSTVGLSVWVFEILTTSETRTHNFDTHFTLSGAEWLLPIHLWRLWRKWQQLFLPSSVSRRMPVTCVGIISPHRHMCRDSGHSCFIKTLIRLSSHLVRTYPLICHLLPVQTFNPSVIKSKMPIITETINISYRPNQISDSNMLWTS